LGDKVKVHNFRIGFATNSSSSHSVVLIPDDLIGKLSDIDSEYGYGWDSFRLVSEEEKLRYLAAQFFCHLPPSSDARRAIVDRLAKEVPSLVNIDIDNEYNVDHQSVWMVRPTPPALDAMITYFKSPNVVVLGGNDNDSDTSHYVTGQKPSLVRDIPEEYGDSMIRLDGEYWTLFNKKTGTKVRYSLNDKVEDFVKGSSPELVDLKITNYCAGGCEFCYQSSTIKGKHAALEDIRHYVDMLAELNVFEIAIGGGEPTDHPEFAEILRYISNKGLLPNFTTFSDRWLDDENVLDAVNETVGAIGVSVHNAAGLSLVKKIKEALAARPTARSRGFETNVCAQHVVGATFLTETGDFLSAAFEERIPVLLLGYKEVGFGKTFKRFDGGEVSLALKLAIQGKATSTVSIDTALVDLYPDFIEAIGAPRALITSPEGAFSCYIDAVMNKMGPSSYVEPKTMTIIPNTAAEVNAVFATY
jgi:hypothetical protein